MIKFEGMLHVAPLDITLYLLDNSDDQDSATGTVQSVMGIFGHDAFTNANFEGFYNRNRPQEKKEEEPEEKDDIDEAPEEPEGGLTVDNSADKDSGDSEQGGGGNLTNDKLAPEPDNSCVVLYSECDYKGQNMEVCDDMPDVKFDIKSVKIPEGQDITIYTETEYGGKSQDIKESIDCIDKFDFKMFLMNARSERVHTIKSLQQNDNVEKNDVVEKKNGLKKNKKKHHKKH